MPPFGETLPWFWNQLQGKLKVRAIFIYYYLFYNTGIKQNAKGWMEDYIGDG